MSDEELENTLELGWTDRISVFDGKMEDRRYSYRKTTAVGNAVIRMPRDQFHFNVLRLYLSVIFMNYDDLRIDQQCKATFPNLLLCSGRRILTGVRFVDIYILKYSPNADPAFPDTWIWRIHHLVTLSPVLAPRDFCWILNRWGAKGVPGIQPIICETDNDFIQSAYDSIRDFVSDFNGGFANYNPDHPNAVYIPFQIRFEEWRSCIHILFNVIPTCHDVDIRIDDQFRDFGAIAQRVDFGEFFYVKVNHTLNGQIFDTYLCLCSDGMPRSTDGRAAFVVYLDPDMTFDRLEDRSDRLVDRI